MSAGEEALLALLPVAAPDQLALAAELTPAQVGAAVGALRRGGRGPGALAAWGIYHLEDENIWVTYLGLGEVATPGDALSALLMVARVRVDPGSGELRPLRPPDAEPE